MSVPNSDITSEFLVYSHDRRYVVARRDPDSGAISTFLVPARVSKMPLPGALDVATAVFGCKREDLVTLDGKESVNYTKGGSHKFVVLVFRTPRFALNPAAPGYVMLDRVLGEHLVLQPFDPQMFFEVLGYGEKVAGAPKGQVVAPFQPPPVIAAPPISPKRAPLPIERRLPSPVSPAPAVQKTTPVGTVVVLVYDQSGGRLLLEKTATGYQLPRRTGVAHNDTLEDVFQRALAMGKQPTRAPDYVVQLFGPETQGLGKDVRAVYAFGYQYIDPSEEREFTGNAGRFAFLPQDPVQWTKQKLRIEGEPSVLDVVRQVQTGMDGLGSTSLQQYVPAQLDDPGRSSLSRDPRQLPLLKINDLWWMRPAKEPEVARTEYTEPSASLSEFFRSLAHALLAANERQERNELSTRLHRLAFGWPVDSEPTDLRALAKISEGREKEISGIFSSQKSSPPEAARLAVQLQGEFDPECQNPDALQELQKLRALAAAGQRGVPTGEGSLSVFLASLSESLQLQLVVFLSTLSDGDRLVAVSFLPGEGPPRLVPSVGPEEMVQLRRNAAGVYLVQADARRGYLGHV